MKIIGFPGSGIAYVDAFYDALRRSGQSVVSGIFSGSWMLEHVEPMDIAHFHWPSFFYSGKDSHSLLTICFIRFIGLLILLRLLGVRIAWTAHNLMPHDPSSLRWVDVLARKAMIMSSHKIFVHSYSSEKIFIKRFPQALKKISIIPHGNFISFYKNTVTRAAAREYFGYSKSTFIYLFIGLCKPYKNLDGLVREFRKISGDVALLIAGNFPKQSYYELIRELSSGDARISVRADYIPGDELQYFLCACDAVVIPYHETLTSGVAVLAMSFGRPVISIDKGFLHDIVTDQTGILFDSSRADDFSTALNKARQTQWSEVDVKAHISQFRFEDAAHVFIKAMSLC
jgi:glycosyltransferase involved in cell wall biosynthesis